MIANLQVQSCYEIANSFFANAGSMKPTSDRELISELSKWTKLTPTKAAQRAGLTPSTLTRPLNQDVNHQLSMPTLAKLRAAFPDFPGFANRPSSAATSISDSQPTRSTDAGEAVPVIALDLSLSMGPGTLIEEFVESEPVYLDLALLHAITRTPSDRLRMVRGIGHSMEPTLRTDDRVLIDINEKAMTRIGGVYWIDYLGAHGIKRLRPTTKGRIMVMSDNTIEPDFEVDAKELRIEGRAIWFARGL